ncbi:hypothetical protein C8R43DRAFT_943527 [Mycena crocata]|nr:hypothetical protein C8R43DRAFT_943527 [Mycena crocata]
MSHAQSQGSRKAILQGNPRAESDGRQADLKEEHEGEERESFEVDAAHHDLISPVGIFSAGFQQSQSSARNSIDSIDDDSEATTIGTTISDLPSIIATGFVPGSVGSRDGHRRVALRGIRLPSALPFGSRLKALRGGYSATKNETQNRVELKDSIRQTGETTMATDIQLDVRASMSRWRRIGYETLVPRRSKWAVVQCVAQRTVRPSRVKRASDRQWLTKSWALRPTIVRVGAVVRLESLRGIRLPHACPIGSRLVDPARRVLSSGRSFVTWVDNLQTGNQQEESADGRLEMVVVESQEHVGPLTIMREKSSQYFPGQLPDEAAAFAEQPEWASKPSGCPSPEMIQMAKVAVDGIPGKDRMAPLCEVRTERVTPKIDWGSEFVALKRNRPA